MGFVTEESMRADYKHLFGEHFPLVKWKGLKVDTGYSLVIYETPEGYLIQVIKTEEDAHSFDDEEVLRHEIILNTKQVKTRDYIHKLEEFILRTNSNRNAEYILEGLKSDT